MTRSHLLFASPLVLGLLALAAATPACGGDDTTPSAAAPTGGDAGSDVTIAPDTGTPNNDLPDASVTNCALADGTDPVSLCLQKSVLLAQHAVFDATSGMPQSWSVTTGLAASDGGVPTHDVHDDIAYGASLATYAMSADVYGDTEIAPTVSGDLKRVATLLEAELATPLAEYGGTTYLRLRRIAQGLRIANYGDDATKIDAVAEAYGLAIYTTYFHLLAAPNVPDAGGGSDAGDGGTPDAGGDASVAPDAGGGGDAGDGGTPDAGDAGDTDGGDASAPPPPPGDAILGTPVTGAPPGTYEYRSDDVASGALALVDMSLRHSVDQAANAKTWRTAAASVLAHLGSRARHGTGLFFARLTTTTGSSVDTPIASSAPADWLVADVQGRVALSFLRVAAIVRLNSLDTVVAPDLEVAGANVLAGAQAVLWDKTTTDATKTACQAAQSDGGALLCGSGYYATYPSADKDQDYTKRLSPNALLYAAIHRSNRNDVAWVATNVEALRVLLTVVSGLNEGFLTVFPDQSGFVPVASRTFGVAGGDGGAPPPFARSYTAAANADALESLNEQWIGVPKAPATIY